MTRRIAGIAWMALVAAFGSWLGFREAFLHAPGLIFEEGYGEVYLLAAAFFPGYAPYRWGKRANGVI
jgi:hypothetical protein